MYYSFMGSDLAARGHERRLLVLSEAQQPAGSGRFNWVSMLCQLAFLLIISSALRTIVHDCPVRSTTSDLLCMQGSNYSNSNRIPRDSHLHKCCLARCSRDVSASMTMQQCVEGRVDL